MKLSLSLETKKQILIGMYIAFMLIVNTVGIKITTIFGVRVSVGIFYMPLLFIISDTVSEIFGKECAKVMANISTFLLSLLVISFYVAIVLPANETWGLQEAFKTLFFQTFRMSLASVISFFISQRLDIYTFNFIRKITSEKYLFLRNILSTILSQGVDTILFMFMAFYKMNDRYTVSFVFSLIIPYYLAKILLSLISTPLCYIGVWWCKKG